MRYIEMYCSYCNTAKMVNISSLIRGKSTGCLCSRNIKHGANSRININEKAEIFANRYDAMHQRCNNKASRGYAGYEGRGIQLNFSRPEFINYMM